MGESWGLGGWAERPVYGLSDDELRHAVDEVCTRRAGLEGLLLDLIRELDGRGLPGRDGAANTAAWMRERQRLSRPTAGRLVRAARALAGAAVTAQALREGQINLEQASVIAGQVAVLPAGRQAEAEAALIGQAGVWEPETLTVLATRIVAWVEAQTRGGDLDAVGLAEKAEAHRLEAAEARAAQRRFASVTDQRDGMVRLVAMVPAADGAVFRTVLDPLSRPSPADVHAPRSAGARRADALVEVFNLALAGGRLPRHGGDPVQVTVTVPLRVLQDQVAHATLDDGTRVSPATARRLACDAALIPAVLGTASQPLDVGRQRRLVTGPLRRALLLRDRGCAFPACDRAPSQTTAHHVQHWADGGVTSLTNSVALCRYHHTTIHHGQWRVTINPADGQPDFWPPTYHHTTGPLRNQRPDP